MTPDDLVRLALRQGARLVGSSYNEPLITAEWAVEVFKVARAQGLKTAFISNGNATPEVLDFIRPWTASISFGTESSRARCEGRSTASCGRTRN